VEFTLKYLKKSFAIRNCTFGDQREKNQKRGIVNREVMKKVILPKKHQMIVGRWKKKGNIPVATYTVAAVPGARTTRTGCNK
jgi:hypothetical protein